MLLNVVVGTAFLVLGALRERPTVRGSASGQGDRPPVEPPPASAPPIEQLAADLRRSLWRHDALVTAGADSGRSLGQIRAMEVAISERALQAARALGVHHPEPPVFGPLDLPRLRALLRDLAAAGLVLPFQVHLLSVGPAH